MSDFSLQRTLDSGSQTVLLCDLSGSMEGYADKGTRVQKLRKAVCELLLQIPDATIICFNDKAWVTQSLDTEEPDGGTYLDLGLLRAASAQPAKTVVITDGEPNDPEAAIKAARQCPGVISAVYVGPDGNTRAIEFCNRLARVGCGESVVNDLSKAGNLLYTLRTVLSLPAPSDGGQS